MTDGMMILAWRGLFGRNVSAKGGYSCEREPDRETERLRALETQRVLRQQREAEICRLLRSGWGC
jgi:hypothetical protein